ncbi:VTT domain-containing protein [Sulfurihydrogenibium sp.]|uniref:VTT domain-containing protein n=1 Tax=Sulfurihydrogenibium sp. TaxID=2053621 RepID=UPI002618797D|nr:VTT domain-containing protein [Sulfurihydrogenibium sp.]
MEILDFILHVDKYLQILINQYGGFVYFILFFIIFAETGFVITPFLPGDSLLFIVGTFSSLNLLDIKIVYPLLLISAILGNVVNFFIGYHFGEKILRNGKFKKFIKEKHIKETEMFFQKHGGKAVIISRFLPIFRTFVPFVAGIGKMDIHLFMIYNFVGGFTWITFFIFLGYFTGNIPFIKENITHFIYAIILVSLIPVVLKAIKR